MIDVYMLSIILFLAALAILIYKDRKKIEIKYYLLFMRRTKRFRDIIENVAQRCPRCWKFLSTVAIVVCMVFMFYGIYMLLNISFYVASGALEQPAFQFILPSLSAQGAVGPGYILIPFWFWIIAVAAILVPHELAHGIVARTEKIRLKSVGLLLLAIFPGAFVEPDEKQLKRSGAIKKLRIFAAGSGANFACAAIIFLLIMFVIWPVFVGSGVEIIDVNATSPAGLAGLKQGMRITELNGEPVFATYSEYFNYGGRYFFEEIGIPKPGTNINVKVDSEIYNIQLADVNKTAYMGITYKPNFRFAGEFFLGFLVPLLTMIWIFNFAVGLVNILPLYPLDGGLILETIVQKFAKKESKYIVRAISYFMLLLIVFDFIGPVLL